MILRGMCLLPAISLKFIYIEIRLKQIAYTEHEKKIAGFFHKLILRGMCLLRNAQISFDRIFTITHHYEKSDV